MSWKLANRLARPLKITLGYCFTLWTRFCACLVAFGIKMKSMFERRRPYLKTSFANAFHK